WSGTETAPPGEAGLDAQDGQDAPSDTTVPKDGPPAEAAGSCNGAPDCPPNTACNPVTHTCGASCVGGLKCNMGCCDGATCVPGDSVTACGSNGGACAPCGAGKPTCAGGTCTDACGGGNGTCGAGFCCNGGHCAGVGDKTCGASGASCVDCTKSPTAPVCLPSGTCGCGQSSDCPSHMACDPNAHTCGGNCSPSTQCNGGCCAGGTCAPDCSQSDNGHACLPVVNICGCGNGGDCAGTGGQCDPIQHICK
ncbi:MAG TPA: hypothetical protein VIF15_10390, partial [Polyangiaceae bacterium]